MDVGHELLNWLLKVLLDLSLDFAPATQIVHTIGRVE